MPDIIHILPDSVANQIAAGEVVQRPASVVKELLENAIDAGSRQISLLIRDAGKTLIQVTDDGCGMSETDARMSLERHATSKIEKAEDLYNIKSLGFRGEALPSIASVSRVEIKTRRKEDENGTFIIVEGGNLIKHEPAACPPGTTISVKNLFYNIPVRKNFLKSDSIEFKHILDYFQNIALVNPHIKFIFSSDKSEIYHLNSGSLRQRLTGILGKRFDSIIVPVEEDTPIVRISGFIGKPEAAKKTKGDQFLFVNRRFIRNPYFNHAIVSAYESLLPAETWPFYALFLEVPPDKLDVNVHPTKTEVKFAEEKAIYLFIKTTVKRSLSQHHVAPSLDFGQESFYREMQDERFSGNSQKAGQLKMDKGKPAETSSFSAPVQGKNKISREDWEELMKVLDNESTKKSTTPDNQQEKLPETTENEDLLATDMPKEHRVFQLHLKYIFTPIHSGFMIIHQQYAHQRILFEEYCRILSSKTAVTQKKLFPEVIEFSKGDFQDVKELMPLLGNIGFDLEVFGTDSFVVNGIPGDMQISSCQDFIDSVLADYHNSQGAKEKDRNENLAKALAIHGAVRQGVKLGNEEMTLIIDKLFACENPYYSPTGKPVLLTISKNEIDRKFE